MRPERPIDEQGLCSEPRAMSPVKQIVRGYTVTRRRWQPRDIGTLRTFPTALPRPKILGFGLGGRGTGVFFHQ